MRTPTMTVWAAALITLNGGCAATRAAWSPGPDHPANPEASSGLIAHGSILPRGHASQSPQPSETTSHEHAERSGAEAGSAGDPPTQAAYVCPMHPAVTSDEPSRCPECGMKLVPKDKPHDHKDHQS